MVTQSAISPEEKLRQKLTSITTLPTPPVVFTQITKVINDPSTSIEKISEILSEDPAISAKVLRLSNSAFYGNRSEITHIKQAIMVLGFEAIKTLVLSSSVFEMFKNNSINPEFQEKYWRHSLSVAMASRMFLRISQKNWQLDPEVAFSAGLLHDIGKLAMCCFMQDDHKEVTKYVEEHNCADYQAENKIIEYAHPLVGKVLSENWNLPESLQNAILNHHFPQISGGVEGNYAYVVHLADYLAVRTFEPKLLEIEDWVWLQDEVKEAFQLNEELLEALSKKLVEEYSNSSTFMQLAMAG